MYSCLAIAALSLSLPRLFLFPCQNCTEKPPVKTKKKKEKKVETTPSANDNNVGESLKEVDPLDEIPSMFEARDLENAKNSPELVEKQKRASGGKVRADISTLLFPSNENDSINTHYLLLFSSALHGDLNPTDVQQRSKLLLSMSPP